MCNELQVSLQGHPRNTADKEELLNKWNELSNYQIGQYNLIEHIHHEHHELILTDLFDIFFIINKPDLSNYRPVYAPKDLLEVLLSLKGPNRQEDE